MTATVNAPTRNPLALDEGSKPTTALLLGVVVVHIVLWIGLILVVPGSDRVDFDVLGDQTMPWVREFIIPLAAVLVFQLIVIQRLGWWRSVFTDPSRTTRRRLWVPPLAMLMAAVVTFAVAGLNGAGAAYTTGSMVTMALVGATEEITFRGIIHVGGRRIFAREGQALVFASVLFGLFHLPNIIVGAETGPTILQVFQTAIIGMALYCLRRTTASLIPCIVLHGVYDWLVVQGNWDKVAASLS